MGLELQRLLLSVLDFQTVKPNNPLFQQPIDRQTYRCLLFHSHKEPFLCLRPHLDHSVLSISPFKSEKSGKLSRTTRSLLIFTAVKDEGKFDRTDLKLNISKLNWGGTNDLSTTVRSRKIFFSSVVANCSANCYWLAPVVLLSGFKVGFVATREAF